MNKDKFFICIGPEKTGTTWLYHQLKQHPDVKLPKDKEIRYFWAKQFVQQNNLYGNVFGKHWHQLSKRNKFKNALKEHAYFLLKKHRFSLKNLVWDFHYFFGNQNDRWYKNLFYKEKLSGDITPRYADLDNERIKHIKKVNSKTKIIISLRDPVERQWSWMKMSLMQHRGVRDIEQVNPEKFNATLHDKLQLAANDYVSLYKRWSEYFPPEQIFVFFYDELIEAPEAMLDRLASFLEIKKFAYKDFDKQINKGLSIKIPDNIRSELIKNNYQNLRNIKEFFHNKYVLRWFAKYDS